jgi:hypothetical protein
LAGRGLRDETPELGRARHLLAVEAHDHIILLQPRLRGRAALDYLRDADAARLARQLEAARVLARHVFRVDAEEVAAAERDELGDGRRERIAVAGLRPRRLRVSCGARRRDQQAGERERMFVRLF